MDIERVSTGVPELDKLLRGGIPKNFFVAVTGEPGTGKTILLLHFIAKGIEIGDKCIYITTEESRESIIRQASQFKWDFQDAINKGNLVIIDALMRPIEDEYSLNRLDIEELVNKVIEIKKRFGYGHCRLAIDCIHPSTNIFMDSGLICHPSEALFENPVTGVDLSKLEQKPGKIQVLVEKPAYKLLKVKTEHYEVIVTENHRFFTLTDKGIREIYARDLQKGMYILGIRKWSVEGRRVFNEKIMQFLGYFIGDGSVSGGRTIYLYDKSIETLRIYNNLIKECFNISGKIKVYRYKNKVDTRLVINSIKLANFLKNLGLTIKSRDKEVPKEIMASTDTEVSAFLRGFFDAEGTIYMKKSKRSKHYWKRVITFSVSSKKLAEQIKYLLLRLGILSSIPMEYRNKWGRTWTVNISDNESIINFSKYIGFSHPKKKEKMKEVLKEIERKQVRIPVPASIIRRIVGKLKKKGMKIDLELGHKCGIDVWKWMRNEIKPTAHSLKKFLEGIKRYMDKDKDIELLTLLLENADKFTWERVESVEDYPLDTDHVYDMTVPETGNYIANGLVVHNSLSAFWLDKPAMARKYSYFIKKVLNRWNMTIMATSQYAITTSDAFGFGVEHIADGIIRFRRAIRNGVLKRYLIIEKMRQTPHDLHLWEIEIVDGVGLKIIRPAIERAEDYALPTHVKRRIIRAREEKDSEIP